MDAPKFKFNSKVWAKWHGGAYFPGKVAGVDAFGCYDIAFDDGDREVGVLAVNVMSESAYHNLMILAPPGVEVPDPEHDVEVHPAAALFEAGRPLSRCKDSAGNPLEVGDAVEARWLRGVAYFPGVVSGIVQAATEEDEDGSVVLLSIAYCDGDKEAGVAEADVRALLRPHADIPEALGVAVRRGRRALPQDAVELPQGVDRCGRSLVVGDAVSAE